MTEIIKITEWLAKQGATAGQTLFEGDVVGETDKAVCLELGLDKPDNKGWWIPKSQIVERKVKPPKGKKIAEIGINDVKVRILGTVVDFTSKGFVIDDGSGQMDVLFEKGAPDWVGKEDKVEVWGIPLTGETHELHANRIKKID